MMWKYLLMVLIPLSAISQTKVRTRVSAPTRNSDLQADKFAITPSDTTGEKLQGRMVFKSSDSTLYIYNGVKWEPTGTGGTGGSDVDLSPYAFKAIPQTVQAATNYTLTINDASTIVRRKLAVDNTVTVPTNASVPFPNGTTVGISMDSTGYTSIIGASGVTIIAPDNITKLRTKGSLATLLKTATNTWQLVGDLFTMPVVSDGKIHLRSLGAGTNATLTTALSFGRTVVIDTTLTITSDIVTGQDKVIEVAKGSQITTTGSSKLVISGRLIAGPYQIFDINANVKIRPYATTEIYPEWFGAQTLDNPRAQNALINSTDAFKKIITLVEPSQYNAGAVRVFGAKIKMSGYYGINDQLNVNGSYLFEGTSPVLEGTGFRWIGNTAGDSAKSMLVFYQSEFGGVKGLGFKGNNTTDTTKRLKAAIRLYYDEAGGKATQRHMTFDNIIIGDPLGFWIDPVDARAFVNGILCDGTNGNNDFHNFRNILMGRVDIGFNVAINQAVDWTIDNYGLYDGGIMYQSQTGGSVNGNNWYAGARTKTGIINCTGALGEQLRINLSNFSSEHLECSYFLQSTAKIKLTCTGSGFIAYNGDFSPNGFALLKGSGIQYGSEFYFQNMRFDASFFGSNPNARMYIEHTSGGLKNNIQFVNCSNAKYIMFRFENPLPTLSNNYTQLSYKGESPTSTSYDQVNLDVLVNARNPKVVNELGYNWLKINDLFTGETEIPANSIVYGEKGKTPVSSLEIKGYKATIGGSFESSVVGVLPARSLIKGVSVSTYDANILPSGYNVLTIGTARSESIWGGIDFPANTKTYNSHPANSYSTADVAENLIIKGWRSLKGSASHSISGNTLTSNNPNSFSSAMVGGIARITTGDYRGKEFIITGYTSGTVVTVANNDNISSSGFEVMTEEQMASSKAVLINITFEQLDRAKSEVDPNYQQFLPTPTVQTRTPVLYERQLVFNGVDTTGFGASSTVTSGGGGGSSYTLPIATTVTLGGIKVGSDFSIDGTGVLSAPNFVTKSTDETIAGAKTFTAPTNFSSSVYFGDNIFSPNSPSVLSQNMEIARSQNTNGSNSGSGHLTLRGYSADGNKQLGLGYNTTGSFAWLQSAHYSVGWTPLQLNPRGGDVLIGNLSGTGNRMVVADANGTLGTQTIPGTGDNKVLPDANYTALLTDKTLILLEPSATRTFTLPAASTMANKDFWIVCRSLTTGRWLLSGSFVQKGTSGTLLTENFINSGLVTGQTYHLVSDGSKWYDIND